MKRASLLLILALFGCRRQEPPPPSPISALDSPPSDTVTPSARSPGENSGTLLLQPPKRKPVRPPSAEEVAHPPAPRPESAPPPSFDPTPSDGTRLPLWKQRAKFY